MRCSIDVGGVELGARHADDGDGQVEAEEEQVEDGHEAEEGQGQAAGPQQRRTNHLTAQTHFQRLDLFLLSFLKASKT